MISITIIEDNKYMREGWKTILDFEPNMCVVASYDNCEDAIASGDLKKSDVILLDIELPGIHGTEGVKLIHDENPNVLVLMVTVHDDNEMIFKALRNGAIGYLLKKVSPTELIEAIQIAVEGGSPMSPNIARKVINSFQNEKEAKIEISDIESTILNELAQGKSYKAISEIVFLSLDGVRYHIRNIYKKLEARNSSEAVAKGISYNLIKNRTTDD